MDWISFFGDELAHVVRITGLMIPMVLLFFGYVALRNVKVYIIWLVLSILMVLIFKCYQDSPAVQTTRGSSLSTFKSLFGFLIAFQFCRLVILRFTGLEYITPSKGGGADIIDGRTPDVGDYLMFACLFGVIFLAQAI